MGTTAIRKLVRVFTRHMALHETACSGLCIQRRRELSYMEETLEPIQDASHLYAVEGLAQHAERPGFRITELQLAPTQQVPWHQTASEQTLLVKSRRPISNVMEETFSRGMALVSLAFKYRM